MHRTQTVYPVSAECWLNIFMNFCSFKLRSIYWLFNHFEIYISPLWLHSLADKHLTEASKNLPSQALSSLLEVVGESQWYVAIVHECVGDQERNGRDEGKGGQLQHDEHQTHRC